MHAANPGSSAATIRLQYLYSQQGQLRELRNQHQFNLGVLRMQAAKFGVTPPLHIVNGIRHEEGQLRQVEQELEEVDKEIDEILRQTATVSPAPAGSLVATVKLNDADYLIESPYPPLGLQSIALPDGQMHSVHRYAGGFEVHMLSRPDLGLRLSFHRHGREVSPVIDSEASKLMIPAGNYVTVNAVALSKWHHTEAADGIPPKASGKGHWNILPPSDLQRIVSNVDWPVGRKEHFITSQIVFEDSYEIWAVADSETKEPHVWFYLDDWNVRPVADMERSTLAFPSPDRCPSESKRGDV